MLGIVLSEFETCVRLDGTYRFSVWCGVCSVLLCHVYNKGEVLEYKAVFEPIFEASTC